MTEFRRVHGTVIQQAHRLRHRRWTAQRAVRHRLRVLGTFSDRDCPLPALVVPDMTL